MARDVGPSGLRRRAMSGSGELSEPYRRSVDRKVKCRSYDTR
jgi:hypothetical protein